MLLERVVVYFLKLLFESSKKKYETDHQLRSRLQSYTWPGLEHCKSLDAAGCLRTSNQDAVRRSATSCIWHTSSPPGPRLRVDLPAVALHSSQYHITRWHGRTTLKVNGKTWNSTPAIRKRLNPMATKIGGGDYVPDIYPCAIFKNCR